MLGIAPPSPYSIWQAKYLSTEPWVPATAAASDVMADASESAVHAASPPKKKLKSGEVSKVIPTKSRPKSNSVAPATDVPPDVDVTPVSEPASASLVATQMKSEVLKKPASVSAPKPTPKKQAKGKAKAKSKVKVDVKPVREKNEDGFEVGAHGEELRDPIKAKKFMAILTSGLMPAAIQELYNDAKKKRGSGEMREAETKIMNRFLKRNEQGKFETNAGDPYFKRVREHKQEGYQEEFHDGCCWDEAVQKVGGEDRLEAAVKAGRIKAQGAGDNPMMLFYHFPRTQIGGRETFSRKDVSGMNVPIADEGQQDFALALDAMIPEMGGILKGFSSEGPSIGMITQGGVLNTKAMNLEEAMQLLKEKSDELNTAIRLCEKVNDSALKLEPLPERLESSLQQLAETQEKAEDIKVIASFGLKFKKDKESRNLLTVDRIEAIVKELNTSTENLIADCRVCKAHAVARQKA